MIEVEPPVTIDGVVGSDGKIYLSASDVVEDMRRESRIHNALLLEAVAEDEVEEAYVHGVAAEKLRILADQYDLLAIELACDMEDGEDGD